MTKSKTTKRALLVSALSMLLCLAMLVGTTFAWFTDTVTTGKNTIIAGNLDVELYARDGSGNYNSVGVNDSLFDNDALWEPGHTEVAYLKVANNGTLALKYKLSVTVDSETSGTNVNGETFKLSDYLVFGQITDTEDIPAYETREEAQEAAGSTMGLNNYTKEGTLYSSEVAAEDSSKYSEEYVALIVYMPTTVGNEANYRGEDVPTISLGVSLVATQTTYEKDGFGDDYDKDATYPAVPVVIDTKDSIKITVADGGELTTDGVTISVPAQAVENDVDAIFSMKLTDSTADSVTYDISLFDEDESTISLTKAATVTAYIGLNLQNVVVYHSGEQMDSSAYGYNTTTGILTIKTTSFSPFTITYDYDDNAELASDGLKYKLASDGTYIVYAGTCTDSVVYIPSFYNGLEVTVIGQNAFSNHTEITKVILGENIRGILGGAFSGCTSLTDISIPDSVKFIQTATAFSNVPLVEVEDGVSYIGNWALKAKSTSSANQSITLRDGTIGIAGYFISTYTTDLVISDSVKYISQRAFENCMYLTSLTIGAGVEEFGTWFTGNDNDYSAMITYFYELQTINFNAVNCKDGGSKSGFYCGGNTGHNYKVTVNIGAAVQRIPEYLFNASGTNCLDIEKVVFAENSVCKEIGLSAFNGNKKLTEIVLPNQLETIGKNAFYWSGLTSVFIPATVKEIGNSAFNVTTSITTMTTVNYGGSEAQWQEIVIGSGNDKLTGATINYNATNA